MLERFLGLILEIAIGVAIFFVILTYLIPLLPAPFNTIMLVVLVIASIVWLIGFLVPRVRAPRVL